MPREGCGGLDFPSQFLKGAQGVAGRGRASWSRGGPGDLGEDGDSPGRAVLRGSLSPELVGRRLGVAGKMEVLRFELCSILIHFHLKSHMWLVATTLVGTEHPGEGDLDP